MSLSVLAAIEPFLPGASDAGIIALVVLRQCLTDWICEDSPPARLTSSLTINAAATSLDHPYATTHRLVGKFKARGVIVKVGTGIVISRAAEQAPAVIRFLAECHDIFLRFAEELHDAGQLDPAVRVVSREPQRVMMIRIALDIILMPFEVFRDRVGDWTSMKLWIAISTLTVRHVTDDPVPSELMPMPGHPTTSDARCRSRRCAR